MTLKPNESISSFSILTFTHQQNDLLLGPILNNILLDKRLNNFDEDFHEDLHVHNCCARELDTCLLEIREIERDINNLKQRQYYFYERYLNFLDKKNQLIDQFIEYHNQYLMVLYIPYYTR